MNTDLLYLSVIETGISLLLGIAVLTCSFVFITLYGKKRYGIAKYNLSFALLKGAILVSVGYLTQGIVQPMSHTIRMIFEQKSSSFFEIASTAGGYFLLYFFIAALYSAVTVIISLKLFTFLTSKMLKINEPEEMRKDNPAVGIITGVVVAVMAYILKGGLVQIMESLIPFQSVINFN